MSSNRFKLFKKTSEAQKPAPKFNVTLLGDSTIDNKIWVSPGIYGNALMDKFDIEWSSPKTRIRRSHKVISCGTELTVVENLMDMLPGCDIRDYTNDGFTTTDLLHGNYKDKVFPRGAFKAFPHTLYEPLTASKAAVADSQFVVLSIGGNNFREFLQYAFSIKNRDDRISFIRNSFPELLENMKREYVEILKSIFEMNQQATLILMTQYYPSFAQNDYHIYEFMAEVGEAMYPGSNMDPQDVIHNLMMKQYAAIMDVVAPYSEKLIVADLTSSLNPHDKANHVRQIEPSGVGGRKIAAMLSHLMTEKVECGHAYQFKADFFTAKSDKAAAKHVHKTEIGSWAPMHPSAFKGNSAKQNNKTFSKCM